MKRTPPQAPLAALGYLLQRRDCFAPLREHVTLGGKTVLHEPHEKLLDGVVRILAACASLKQINTRLRPDTALVAAWGRAMFADQATSACVLEAFTPESVAQRRTAVGPLDGREGRALPHPVDQELLCVDIDLTGVPAGRRALD